MAKLVRVPVPSAPRGDELGPSAARLCPLFPPVAPPRPRSTSPPLKVSVPAVGAVLGVSALVEGEMGSGLASGSGVGSGAGAEGGGIGGAGVGTTLGARFSTSACFTAAMARATALGGGAVGGGAVTISTVTSLGGARVTPAIEPSQAMPGQGEHVERDGLHERCGHEARATPDHWI